MNVNKNALIIKTLQVNLKKEEWYFIFVIMKCKQKPCLPMKLSMIG